MNKILPRQYDYGGVYMIENLTNKKVYIGSSTNIEHRLQVHRRALKKGTHSNKALQEDFNRHHLLRVRVLYVEVIPRRCSYNRSNLYAMEWKFIEQYDAINKGYNVLGMCENAKKSL